MSQIAIRVENLSKQYYIGSLNGERRFGYNSLRDTISDAFTSPFRRARALLGGQAYGASEMNESIWALKDVSFEVKRGEVMGIIGNNGAGKSTLLKILSRIIEPTEGQVTIYGRVSSLLEVGTGFHPELTGRENIYLNGIILGMRRAKIDLLFDEIVAFAEIEKFIDTPVKHYSTGMYLRLGFAIAAHLEPEIWIVDEVLAVGDAAFQKKCLGKMGDVAQEGRTVLFVSHNMRSIQELCTRTIVLRAGSVDMIGPTDTCVQSYLKSSMGVADLTLPNITRHGNGVARFSKIELLKQNGDASSQIRFGESLRVRFTITSQHTLSNINITFSFISAYNFVIQGSSARDGGISCHLTPGTQSFECEVKPMILVPGIYYIRAGIFSNQGEIYDGVDQITTFEVLPISNQDSDTSSIHHLVGQVYVPYQWSVLSDQS